MEDSAIPPFCTSLCLAPHKESPLSGAICLAISGVESLISPAVYVDRVVSRSQNGEVFVLVFQPLTALALSVTKARDSCLFLCSHPRH